MSMLYKLFTCILAGLLRILISLSESVYFITEIPVNYILLFILTYDIVIAEKIDNKVDKVDNGLYKISSVPYWLTGILNPIWNSEAWSEVCSDRLPSSWVPGTEYKPSRDNLQPLRAIRYQMGYGEPLNSEQRVFLDKLAFWHDSNVFSHLDANRNKNGEPRISVSNKITKNMVQICIFQEVGWVTATPTNSRHTRYDLQNSCGERCTVTVDSWGRVTNINLY